MIRLASAILIQMIKDVDNGGYQEDIDTFIKSSWFEQLALLADLDPDYIKDQIKSGTYRRISLRAAYR